MEDLSNVLVNRFLSLLTQSELKNIWPHENISRLEIKKLEKAIYNQWKDLEAIAGREVFKEELWERIN